MEKNYMTKDLLGITGMSRDTLRHYEQMVFSTRQVEKKTISIEKRDQKNQTIC